jgi:hypothetical protein
MNFNCIFRASTAATAVVVAGRRRSFSCAAAALRGGDAPVAAELAAGGKSNRQQQQQQPKQPKQLRFPPRPTVNEADIEESFLKGSGPGGQKIVGFSLFFSFLVILPSSLYSGF